MARRSIHRCTSPRARSELTTSSGRDRLNTGRSPCRRHHSVPAAFLLAEADQQGAASLTRLFGTAPALSALRPPQIQRRRKLYRLLFRRNLCHEPRRVALLLEARTPPCFRLVRVHRIGLVVASTRMRDVVDAAAE